MKWKIVKTKIGPIYKTVIGIITDWKKKSIKFKGRKHYKKGDFRWKKNKQKQEYKKLDGD